MKDFLCHFPGVLWLHMLGDLSNLRYQYLDQLIALHVMLKYYVEKIGQDQLQLKERLHLYILSRYIDLYHYAYSVEYLEVGYLELLVLVKVVCLHLEYQYI